MAVFKPLQLSLQYKTFGWKNKNHLSVTVLLGFPFSSKKEVLLEQDLWSQLPDLLGENKILDVGMPKPQGEVLVYGKYFAPGGHPVSADQAQLVMGSVDKTLAIIGQRYWRTLLAPTKPEAFSEMSITYNHAFGGTGYNKNPQGKGLDEEDVSGEQRLPMPNIENPDNLLTSTNQRPDPAGFGPLDMMWEPRSLKMGTYNEKWHQEIFPGLPDDIDWTHFNAAPLDQWIDDFWHGDEKFRLLNMHPEKSELGGQLPAFRVRCFVEKNNDQEPLFREIDMRAETTYLFPEAETGVLLYRGTLQVEEDDATDINHFLAAYEDLNVAPRSKKYYQDALNSRLDENKIFKFMMSTKDIIPDSERCGYARMMDGVEQDGESELAKNLQAKADAEKQKAEHMLEQQKSQLKEKLQASGIDPAPYLDKLEGKGEVTEDPQLKAIMDTIEEILPGATKGNVKDLKFDEVDFSKFDELNKKIDVMAEAKKEEAKQQLKDILAKYEGTDADEKMRGQIEAALEQMDELPVLPRPAVDESMENMKVQMENLEKNKEKMLEQGVSEEQIAQMHIDLEGVEQQLQSALVQLKDTYRSGAQYIEGKPPHTVPLDIIQYRFKKRLDKGESLEGLDLSGVDFSGLDLSGQNLSECYLEYTNFSNANLRGANLKRSILTHSNLSNADLTDAILDDCNLGDSRLTAAVITNANFRKGILTKSDLTHVKLINCDLSEVDFLEATMKQMELEGCKFKNANFIELNFSASSFVACELIECNFIQSQLEGCNFSTSDLSRSNFVECKLDRSKFSSANLTNVRFLAESSLKNCNFESAILDQASFRGADAEGSSFEKSTFHMADFGEANLQKTRFYGASGKRAMMMKADLGYADFSSVNLMEGSLQKARLTGANLSYSNFYSVEFMGAIVGDTNFTGANLDLTELEQWRPSR